MKDQYARDSIKWMKEEVVSLQHDVHTLRRNMVSMCDTFNSLVNKSGAVEQNVELLLKHFELRKVVTPQTVSLKPIKGKEAEHD